MYTHSLESAFEPTELSPQYFDKLNSTSLTSIHQLVGRSFKQERLNRWIIIVMYFTIKMQKCDIIMHLGQIGATFSIEIYSVGAHYSRA